MTWLRDYRNMDLIVVSANGKRSFLVDARATRHASTCIKCVSSVRRIKIKSSLVRDRMAAKPERDDRILLQPKRRLTLQFLNCNSDSIVVTVLGNYAQLPNSINHYSTEIAPRSFLRNANSSTRIIICLGYALSVRF